MNRFSYVDVLTLSSNGETDGRRLFDGAKDLNDRKSDVLKQEGSFLSEHQTLRTDLQHVGEVDSDALQQHAVGLQPGALPAGDVAVALAHQDSHLLHDGASVYVVAQSLVDGRLPVVETGQHTGFEQN